MLVSPSLSPRGIFAESTEWENQRTEWENERVVSVENVIQILRVEQFIQHKDGNEL